MMRSVESCCSREGSTFTLRYEAVGPCLDRQLNAISCACNTRMGRRFSLMHMHHTSSA
jgi:hypothetical protein